ncbi:MAG TPA: glycosyltransferase family 4 protein [Gaiellaceae bacterium]
MHLALVDPLSYTPPYDDGLAAALARRGHEVTLLAGPFLHGAVPKPVGYRREEVFLPLSGQLFRPLPRSRLRLLLKGVEYLPSARRLLRRLEQLRPDAVHIQWLPRPELDRRWVRLLARPSVLTAHDVVPRRQRARVVWPELLRSFDRIVVHSEQGVAELVGLGLGRERLRRIPHPVFPAPRALPPPRGETLLFFGLIRDYKGLDVLVRALAEIPEARLVVAGDPVDPIEPVRSLARELGVEGRIEWQLGYLPETEVTELMERAAVVVLPYRRLDSSGVLATAIGYRRPVVVSDVGSLGEQVREYGAGQVVPAGDSAALARACRSLLASPGELERAAAGAARAAAALTWDAAAEQHERLYEELRG